MVAKVHAYKASDGSVHDCEEEAYRWELHLALDEHIDGEHICPGCKVNVIDNIFRSFGPIYERMVAYKKSLPAYAVAKEDKEKNNEH